MNEKITEMTLVTSLDGTEDVPIVKAGANKRVKTSVLAASAGLYSGTYTPVTTNTTNVASSTPSVFQYLRIGNVVNFSGVITIQATGGGAVELRFTLPFTSNFATVTQCAGTASNGAQTGYVAAVISNTRASIQYIATGGLSTPFLVHGTYSIIP